MKNNDYKVDTNDHRVDKQNSGEWQDINSFKTINEFEVNQKLDQGYLEDNEINQPIFKQKTQPYMILNLDPINENRKDIEDLINMKSSELLGNKDTLLDTNQDRQFRLLINNNNDSNYVINLKKGNQKSQISEKNFSLENDEQNIIETNIKISKNQKIQNQDVQKLQSIVNQKKSFKVMYKLGFCFILQVLILIVVCSTVISLIQNETIQFRRVFRLMNEVDSVIGSIQKGFFILNSDYFQRKGLKS